jgi:hypothetical protein
MDLPLESDNQDYESWCTTLTLSSTAVVVRKFDGKTRGMK